MTLSRNHHHFGAARLSQSLCNDRCQNILYKAVFEHFIEIRSIAALLLASKSFQNSSFGANFLVNFVVDENTIVLLDAVLSPSSCFSMQFVPSLHIMQSTRNSGKVNRSFTRFVDELVSTKYLSLSLRSLTLDCATNAVLSSFFGSSTSTSNASWPQLQDLTLQNCVRNETVIEIISKKAVQLRSVNFSENLDINDAWLEHLSDLSCLTSLNFYLCNNITDAGLQPVSKLSGITSLNLHCCSKITDSGLEHISKLSNITQLDLFHCRKITDAGLEHVSKLSSITSLDLNYCDKITDVGLQTLATLRRMTSLHLFGCGKISDAAKKMLNNSLPNCKICDNYKNL